MLVDKNGTAVNLGDWITNTLTGALYEVLEVTDLAALCAKIDEIFDPDQKQQVDIKANEISDHYVVNPADETITDIMGDFLAYDYNTKFYRVAYIAFARRIMRAHLYEVNQTQDEFNKILAQIYAQIKEINDRLDSGELIPHFTIGTVATSDTPQVTITGTVQNPVLNFFLPKGAKGDKGEQGEQGPQGIQGERGPQGEQGPKGDQGERGEQGPKGDTGERGPQGLQGVQGDKGDPGIAATIAVGTVTTGDPGTAAQVTNSGDTTNAVFNFTIPQGIQGIQGIQGERGPQGLAGQDGAKGDKGDTGAPGQAATVTVGKVTSLPPGSSPTVTNSGSSLSAVLDFGLVEGKQGERGPQGGQGVQGEKGDPGPQGERGPQGAQGQAATIDVGTVTTGAAGSPASVVNKGTENAAVFDFTIPQGAQGVPGTAATITVGTVTSLTAGSQPTVSNVGTATAARFDFGIPQGATGAKGDKGDTGAKGPKGDTGAKGDQGIPGTAATVAVGTVTTLPPGSSATVTNAGTASAARFNFGIPQGATGAKGDKGDTGAKGDKGLAATVAVGTVKQLAPGSTPTVTNAGTSSNAVFDFGIPVGQTGAKGDKGEQGDRGATGAKGADGAAATIVVKSTTTLSPGSQATVVNAGTSNAAQLEFGIPKGDTPVRGVDYWTDADQRQIVSETVAAIPVASASVNGLISLNTVDGRMSAPVVTLAGTSSAYTGTLSGPPWATTLAGLKGRLLVIVPSVTSASVDVTLNINSLGAKNIRRFTQTGTPVAVPTAGYFRLSVPYLVMYDGTQFVVVGDVQPNGGADFISPVAVSKGGFGGTTVAEAWTTVGVPYAGTAAPKVAATAAVGTATKWAREDHVHPVQTAVSGNAGTATKLATARGLWGQSFDGSAAVSGDMSGVGNILSSATNTKTVGTSANKFLAMYATTFYGALSGNATTATSATSAGKLSASRTFSLTGNAAGSGAGDLSGNISINVTAVTATALASTAKEIYVGAASSAPANAVLIIEP